MDRNGKEIMYDYENKINMAVFPGLQVHQVVHSYEHDKCHLVQTLKLLILLKIEIFGLNGF